MPKEVKREISKKTGNIRITYDDGSTQIVSGSKAKKPTVAKSVDASYTASQAPTNVPGATVVGANVTAPVYTKQHYDPKKGYYVATDPSGKEIKVEMSDFEARHPKFIEAYKNKTGKDLSKDLLSKDAKTRADAAEWFQKTYAQEAAKAGIDPWFDPTADPSKSPKGIDKKFGFHTWSAPALKLPDTPAIPGVTPVAAQATPGAPQDVISSHFDQPEINPDYAPWWLQDQIKTFGAAADFARVKKRMPWQATPALRLAEPTFYDPTRALAANTEMVNLTMQAANAFGNPQLSAATALAAQAQGAGNAANIIAQNQGLNVGVANEFEGINTGAINQFQGNRANAQTQLYDKNIAAQQNFDNSRNMARQNLRQSYIDAITNRRMTQNLNTMYPQYAVDPSLGGPMFFKNPRDFTGKAGVAPDFAKSYTEYMNLPQMTPEVAAKQARLSMGIEDPDDVINQSYGKQFPNMGYPTR